MLVVVVVVVVAADGGSTTLPCTDTVNSQISNYQLLLPLSLSFSLSPLFTCSSIQLAPSVDGYSRHYRLAVPEVSKKK